MKVTVTTEKDGQEHSVEGDMTFSDDYGTIEIVCEDYRTITIKKE